MNLNDVMKTWRSQDLSPLYQVDKNLLHAALRQEQGRQARARRRGRRFMYVANGVLLLMAVLFLAIMVDPNDDDVLSAWDYAVGVTAVVAAMTMVWTLYALRQSRQTRERDFGDSLRDHLRRRIVQIDYEATVERRLGLILMAAALTCGWAISIAAHRINDVPWGEFRWWPSGTTLLWFGFFYLIAFRWAPRHLSRSRERRSQLEALLKELDSQ